MWKPVVSFVVSQDMATTRHPTVSASPSAASTNTSRSCSSWCCPSSGNRRPRQFSSQPLLEKGDLHDFLFFMFFLRSSKIATLHSSSLYDASLVFIDLYCTSHSHGHEQSRLRQVKSSDFEMIRRQMMLELQDVTSQQPLLGRGLLVGLG